MQIAIIILSLLIVCLVIALYLKSKKIDQLHRFEVETNVKQAHIDSLNQQIATIKAEQERADKAAEDKLQMLAHTIIEKSANDSEQRLNNLLRPFTSDLKEFRQAVKNAYDTEARERFSLQNEIRNLMLAGQSISHEAKELTMALRGNSKVQGDWGEMILERILEMSGLKQGYHFDLQVSTDPATGQTLLKQDGGIARPDAVVYYPRQRCVVIDSKVSLTAFTRYINATSEPERAENGRQHVASLKGHIESLARKNYQDIVGENRLDFVILLIPSEPAYMAAMNLEPSLWEKAYSKRVVIASPTHLISMLRMLEQMWKQDAINKNVKEIGRLSGAMIDKLAGFFEEMGNIEKSLKAAHTSYDKAYSRLFEGNGNVVATAHKIVKLGAKATKEDKLPECDENLIE